MKQTMIDLMSAMMPFMRPLALGAGAGLVLAIILRLSGARGMARLLGALVVLVGLFFLACEGAGRVLGFEPTVLFADPVNRTLYHNQWPFWTIGLAALVLGWLVRAVSRPSDY